MERNDIQRELQNTLDSKRYEHTLGVMYTAAALCMQHNIDVRKGLLAGLLHDCAKAYKNKEQYKMCRKYGISLNSVEEENYALIHAKLGAYLAIKDYGIEEEDILSAITYHTTGKPNMSLLEKILYIADYIEPNRELPRVEALRTLAFQDIDETMYQLLELTNEHLTASNKPVDEMTKETYQYYKEQRK